MSKVSFFIMYRVYYYANASVSNRIQNIFENTGYVFKVNDTYQNYCFI